MEEADGITGSVETISAPNAGVCLFHAHREDVGVDDNLANLVEKVATLVLVEHYVFLPVDAIRQRRKRSCCCDQALA